MIYSVTLNPAIDYVVTLPTLQLGAVNLLDSALKLPGGKGINVSRILQALGQATTALGFAGGVMGQFLATQLAADDLPVDFTPIKADTRINVKLKAAEETELNAPGPQISATEAAQFKHALAARLHPGDVVVMAGSLPTGLPTTFYRDLIPLIRDAQADFVIDTTGQALLDTLPSHPLLVKPNHHELAALFGDDPYPDIASTVVAGRKLLALGAQHVLVSMAGAGALLITADHAYHGMVPAGHVVNSVGAGDSMLAGFTGTWQATKDELAAFKTGIACGSATAFSKDLATKDKIAEVNATIQIETL